MTGPPLSNRLADLAERAGEAFRRGNARSIEAAAAYLEAGGLLAEAKAECAHGQWLPFLARADIPKRTAQRMMQLAGSRMDAEPLASLGVRAALANLARPRKSVTVTHLDPPERTRDTAPEPPAMTAAARRQAQRRERRERGQCIECGAPTDGSKARCEACRERVATRERNRRALARMGEDLAPRVIEAAETGRGLKLTPAEVAALAEIGPGKGDSRAPHGQPHGQSFTSAPKLPLPEPGDCRDPAA